MKTIKDIIYEKLIVNKNMMTHSFISYENFKNKIKSIFDLSQNVLKWMFNGIEDAPIGKMSEREYKLLDKENNRAYKSLFELVDALMNGELSKEIKESTFQLLFVIDKTIEVYFNEDIDLGGNDPDEYFLIFIDYRKEKSYIYQVK